MANVKKIVWILNGLTFVIWQDKSLPVKHQWKSDVIFEDGKRFNSMFLAKTKTRLIKSIEESTAK